MDYSALEDLQREKFCDWRKVLVVVQQLAVMFQHRSGDDAVIGLADGDAPLSHMAVDIRSADKSRSWHWQHDQGADIAPHPPKDRVIGYPLGRHYQNDSA